MRRHRKLAPGVPLALLPILVLMVASPVLAGPASDGAVPQATVPEATFPEATDQHGDSHRWLAPFEGLTLVDFAASWCGPCRRSLPRLEEFAAEHPEVRVLVVSVDRSARERDRLVESLDLELPVLWDEGHAIAEHYRPPTMPSSFLVGPDGLILHVSPGSSEDEWRQLKEQIARLTPSASVSASVSTELRSTEP